MLHFQTIFTFNASLKLSYVIKQILKKNGYSYGHILMQVNRLEFLFYHSLSSATTDGLCVG